MPQGARYGWRNTRNAPGRYAVQYTITEAAKAYGMARSTIHRAINAGRITAVRRGDGVRVIDLTELIRVWGEPPAPKQAQREGNAPDDDALRELHRELRALRDEVAALRGELEQQRRLPPPPTLFDAIRRRLARWIAPD